MKPTLDLTARERRWHTRPWWQQALSAWLMVALVLGVTPTEVRAQVYSPVFYYYVSDHLGSSSVMTDRAGVLVQHYEYAAYGNERYNAGTPALQVSNRYTGQVLDEETGLYYYNARYYDPELGRFTQPDTIVPGAANPQNLNRYSYADNNPLKYTDPSGHAILESIIVGILVATAVGAAVGAATAAAAGGDVGKGALTGAISGALVYAGGIAGGAAAGAINAAITGGDIGKGALIGAIGAAVSSCIGYGIYKLDVNPNSFGSYAAKLGASAAGGAGVGAAGAAIEGQDVGLGAAYGAAGGAMGFVIGYSLYTYLTEKGEWFFPNDRSDNFHDHDTIGTGGIMDTPEKAQFMANRIEGPAQYNPSQGPINDVMQSVWQKLLLGYGDSLAKQFAEGVSQLRPGPITVYGHSQGSITVVNAALHVSYPRGSTLNLTAPAISRIHTGLLEGSGGLNVLYRQNYFDMSATYSPSFNPAKFASGIPGFFLTRYFHNWRNAYGP